MCVELGLQLWLYVPVHRSVLKWIKFQFEFLLDFIRIIVVKITRETLYAVYYVMKGTAAPLTNYMVVID